jgi:hypothetical protein
MMTMEKAQKIIEAGIGESEGNRPADEYCSRRCRRQSHGLHAHGWTWLGSIDIAINKAFTAKAFDISTPELGHNSQPGDQFFGIHV